MSYFAVKKGLRIWYEHIAPTKFDMPTIVFIHGWVQNHTAWKLTVSRLKRHGYGFLLLDLPGHGYSSTPSSMATFEIINMAKICSKLIKHLRLENFVIVGHSMGGMITQYLYKKVKPRALVLADTTYTSPLSDLSEQASVHLPVISALLSALAERIPIKRKYKIIDLSRRPSSKEMLLWLRGANSTNARALLACLQSILHLDSSTVLKQIKCPVLLIVGSNDTRTPPLRMEKMQNMLLKSRLVTIENGGHSTHLTNPKIFSEQVHLFLKSSLL